MYVTKCNEISNSNQKLMKSEVVCTKGLVSIVVVAMMKPLISWNKMLIDYLMKLEAYVCIP